MKTCLLWREFNVLHPQSSAGAGARWSDRRSAQRARREGSSESNCTSFQEWGAASPVESHYRVYSCLFAKCVVEMCSEVGSAWDECRAEEDLGVPGKGNPGKSQTAAPSGTCRFVGCLMWFFSLTKRDLPLGQFEKC